MGSGQSPKYLAESIPASAGVIWGVLHRGIKNRVKNSKRFFYFGSEMWYYRGRPYRPSPFITLYTHYLYSHTNKTEVQK